MPPVPPYSIDQASEELQANFVAAINRVLYDITHELNERMSEQAIPDRPTTTTHTPEKRHSDVDTLPIRFIYSLEQLESRPKDQTWITVTPVPFRFNRNRRSWSQCAVLDWKLKQTGEVSGADFSFPRHSFLAGHLYKYLSERSSLYERIACITSSGSGLDISPSKYFESWPWKEEKPGTYTRVETCRQLVQELPPEWQDPSIQRAQEKDIRRLYHDWIDQLDKWCHRFIILVPVYDVRPFGTSFGDISACLMLNVGISPDGQRQSSEISADTRNRYQRACDVVVDRALVQLDRFSELLAAEIHKTAIIQASTQTPKWDHDLLEHFVFSLRFAQLWEAAHVYRNGRWTYSYGWIEVQTESGSDRWERRANIAASPVAADARAVFAPNGLPDCLQALRTRDPRVDVVEDEAISWDTANFFSSNGNSADDLGELSGVQIVFEFTRTARIPSEESPYRKAFCRELQYQQLDVLRTIRPSVRMRRAAVRNAVSAIMGRNMSHNIGSHVLARLAASELDAIESGAMGSGAACRAREALLSYLQRRMDFVAEVSTADRAYWSQPLSLQSVVNCLNFAEEYKRITAGSELPGPRRDLRDRIRGVRDEQRPLLLSFITGKESLSASVEFGVPNRARDHTEDETPRPTFFACPGGEVGAHALLVILENVIRNSARHGDDALAANAEPVVVHVVPSDSSTPSADHSLLEITIIDLHTRLTSDGRRLPIVDSDSSQLAERQSDDAKKPVEDGTSLGSDDRSIPDRINAALHADSLIDQSGQPNPRNWGVREMQICAHYLRHLPLSALESVDPSTRNPTVLQARTQRVEVDGEWMHCLTYTLYLQNPRLVALLAYDAASARTLRDALPVGLGIQVLEVSLLQGNQDQHGPKGMPDEASAYTVLLYDKRLKDLVESVNVRPSVSMLRLAQSQEEMGAFLRLASTDAQPERFQWMEGIYKMTCSAYLARKKGLKNRVLHGLWAVDGPMPTSSSQKGTFQPQTIVATPKRGGDLSPVADDWFPPPLDWREPEHDSFLGAAWIDHPETRDGDTIDDSQWMFDHAYHPFASNADLGPQQPRWIAVEPGFFECAHRSQRERLIADDAAQELLCAAVARVAIIDERVQSGRSSKFRGMTLSRLWAGIGVWVPDRDRCHLDSPKWDDCRQFLDDPSPLNWQFPIDVLVIHLTVLEALRKQRPANTTLDQCLLDLRKGTQADHPDIEVVVVTGRGVTGTAMSHRSDRIREARYLPISAVQEHVLTRPSKLGLMRALWNSRRVEVASSPDGAH